MDGSVAAVDLAPNSVGPTQIMDGAIKSAEIAAGAIGSNHIADGAITSSKLADDVGIRGYEIVTHAFTEMPHSSMSGGSVTCPLHKVAVGGGFAQPTNALFTIRESYPEGRNWRVSIENDADEPHTFIAYAVCVNGDAS